MTAESLEAMGVDEDDEEEATFRKLFHLPDGVPFACKDMDKKRKTFFPSSMYYDYNHVSKSKLAKARGNLETCRVLRGKGRRGLVGRCVCRLAPAKICISYSSHVHALVFLACLLLLAQVKRATNLLRKTATPASCFTVTVTDTRDQGTFPQFVGGWTREGDIVGVYSFAAWT